MECYEQILKHLHTLKKNRMVSHLLKEVHLDNIEYELLAHVVTQKQNGAHAHRENKIVGHLLKHLDR